jgi:beta-lactamase regulating signal transducer with metallopeptidase domain
MNTYLTIWIVLAIVVLVMAAYRYVVARRDDKSLHVAEEDPRLIREQLKAERKIEVVDRWGQGLTVIVIMYGLVIAGVHLYQAWQEGAKINW